MQGRFQRTPVIAIFSHGASVMIYLQSPYRHQADRHLNAHSGHRGKYAEMLAHRGKVTPELFKKRSTFQK
jgi:hypothetical protein